MKESLRKIILWAAMAVAIIGSICCILFAIKYDKFNPESAAGFYSLAYIILLVLIALCLIAMLFFVILRIVKGEGKGLLIGFGLLVVLCVVSFLLSSGTDLSQTFLDKYNATEKISKLVGAGSIATYILVFASAVAIVYVELAQLFKKK